METDLAIEQIIEGYYKFELFITDDFNKTLILNTIDNCINGSEWPKTYFNLRDEFLPDIMGEEASSFLFWYALGGNFNWGDELPINTEVNVFLNFIFHNYSLKFVRAKEFNINPFGFDSVSFTHGENNEMFNTYFMRNDSEQFLLRLNTTHFSIMIEDILNFYSHMVQHNVIQFDEGNKSLESLIDNIKKSLNALEGRLEMERENER